MMGYDRHHAIAITTYSDDRLPALQEQIRFLDMNATPPMRSRINAWFTIFIVPDGSKEGWDDSDVGDGQRNQLVEWLDTQRFDDGSSPYAWVEVQYGDNEEQTLVVRHSDERHRQDAANKEGNDALKAQDGD